MSWCRLCSQESHNVSIEMGDFQSDSILISFIFMRSSIFVQALLSRAVEIYQLFSMTDGFDLLSGYRNFGLHVISVRQARQLGALE